MAASDYLEAAVLEHIFEGSAFTQPTVWVGLSIGDPLDDGSELLEPVGGDYARVRPVDDSGRWEVSEDGGITTAENKGAITFPEATADWGEVTHVVLFDSETSGGSNNILMSVPLDDARDITTGATFVIAAGDLTIELD